MSPHQWFRYAHYIYTHAQTLIVISGIFYVLGRSTGGSR